MRAIRRESFDSGDARVPHGGNRRQAGARGLPVEVHRAGAALADAAAVFRSVEVENVPKHPEKWRIGRSVDAWSSAR